MRTKHPCHHVRKVAAVCLALILLSSCVGIDARFVIRENGAGTLSLTYRVSQELVELGQTGSEKAGVPLPLSEADFRRSLDSARGVRLASFHRSENAKDLTVSAQIAFDSIEALANLPAFQDAGLSLTTEGGRHTLSQVISRAPREPVSEDSLEMVDALFDGYDLAWSIEVPRAIQSSTRGMLSADRRTLTYRTSITEILRSAADIDLSVSW